jgi:hypothetical protein
MNPSRSLNDCLCDPQVKDYFLHLLDQTLSPDEKYQKFVEFCIQSDPTGQSFPLRTPLSFAPTELDELSARLLESIEHALGRMQRSQHQDGGWGLQIEQSNFWQTVFAVRFLKLAQDLPGLSRAAEIEPLLRRGVAYLEQHSEYWAADTLATSSVLSIYEIGQMVHCFYRLGRSFLRRDSAQHVYRSIDHLYRCQNADGGWDASLWEYAVRTPIHVWSEVGATSIAIQALAETHDERFRGIAERAIQWLSAVQNPDGSWNDGSCRPDHPAFQLTGKPSVSKTCDALQGILAGEALDVSLHSFQSAIERAVNWLVWHELPILDRHQRPSSWKWPYVAADYENACLTLEALLNLPAAFWGNPSLPTRAAAYSVDTLDPSAVLLPFLSATAGWLIQGQRRQPDDPEDGSWVLGHTARIGLALARFYQILQLGTAAERLPWIP